MGYEQAMMEDGAPPHVAKDITSRLRAEGVRRVLWANAMGGRRGHSRVFWDVRVAATEAPAAEVLPSALALGQRPLGTTPVALLQDEPGVLAAYTQPSQPAKLRLPSAMGPPLGKALRLPARLQLHYTRVGHAAVTHEHLGATINVAGDGLPLVEHALRRLVDIVLDDFDEPDGQATAAS